MRITGVRRHHCRYRRHRHYDHRRRHCCLPKEHCRHRLHPTVQERNNFHCYLNRKALNMSLRPNGQAANFLSLSGVPNNQTRMNVPVGCNFVCSSQGKQPAVNLTRFPEGKPWFPCRRRILLMILYFEPAGLDIPGLTWVGDMQVMRSFVHWCAGRVVRFQDGCSVVSVAGAVPGGGPCLLYADG